MAPRVPIPLREIVYTISPYNQEIVMQGAAKVPGKIAKYFKQHWASLIIFNAVLFGPQIYADNYVEQEKMESRY